MSRPFRQGVLAGVFAPIAFIAAFCMWTYRFTGRLPLPVVNEDDEHLTIGLVTPEDAPAIWDAWRLRLEPLWARVRATFDALRAMSAE